jgi:hypothetical protein
MLSPASDPHREYWLARELSKVLGYNKWDKFEPEELPTPQKSIGQLQREEEKRLKQGPQLPLFDTEEL